MHGTNVFRTIIYLNQFNLLSGMKKTSMKTITIDFETRYNSKLSLKKLTTTEYVRHKDFYVFGMGIKENDQPTQWVPHDDIPSVLEAIDWREATIVAHNTRFEAAILAWHYGINPAFWADTMSMAKADRHYASASLKAVAQRMFPNDPTKRKGDELILAEGLDFLDPETEEAIARYCIQDVDLCKAIYDELYKWFPLQEQRLIDLTIRLYAEPSMALDRELLEKTLDEEIEKKREVLTRLDVDSIELSSNQRFAKLLEAHGIEVPMKVSPTTGKSTFAFSKADLGFQKLLQDERSKDLCEGRLIIKSTQNQTRAERLIRIHDENSGMLPVPLNYYGAHTGRFSGSDKVNIQNLPRGGSLRKALIAPNGGWLVSCDASQIEARMLAWLTSEDSLTNQFLLKEDVYKNFASRIFSKPVEEIDSTERFVGKTSILGLGYGMGHKKFQLMLSQGMTGPKIEISEGEAKHIVDTYRTTYAAIPRFWQYCQQKITQMTHPNFPGEVWKRVVQFLPYRILLPNDMSINYEKSSFNTEMTFGGKITENIVQALARIVLSNHMLEINEHYPVAFTVHDEVTVVCADDEPQEVLDYMIDVFRKPPKWAYGLPLDAEGDYGRSYSK